MENQIEFADKREPSNARFYLDFYQQLYCEIDLISLAGRIPDSDAIDTEFGQIPMIKKRTMNCVEAFSYFGALLGSLPPAVILGRMFFGAGSYNNDSFLIFFLCFLAILTTATTGYFTGKRVGRTVQTIEGLGWAKMAWRLPLIGLVWGITSGGIGGLFVFVIGALFGAIIGGMTGAVSLLIFGTLHKLLRKHGEIDRNQYYPISVGITLTICAFIMGL